jgi:hypothetical protein
VKERSSELDIYQSYSRRAKAAAWTASLPGLFGGILTVESSTPLASAAIEKTAAQELRSPKNFANHQDTRIRSLAKEIISAPRVKVQAPTSKEDLSGPYRDFKLYTLVRKGSEPNHFDVIRASISSNPHNRPLSITVVENAETTDVDKIREFDNYYDYVTNNPFGKDAAIEIWDQKKPFAYTIYQAGKETAPKPASDELPTIRYSKKPNLVNGEFNKFFNLALEIINEH